MKQYIHKIIPHAGVILFFFLIVWVYFYPAFEGKVLQQGDVTNFSGAAQELVEYGKPSGWTGSMFSGMPSYHITGYSIGADFVGWVRIHIWEMFNSETATPIFIFLLTSYLLFLVLGAPWWLAALGAIAVAFSSYNLIIIAAGHMSKVWTLAYVPLVLAGLFSVFKQKYWLGGLLFVWGLALTISSNHLQITYYSAIFCAILYMGFLVEYLRKKQYKRLGISTALLTVGVILAVLANTNNLYLNYESGQESMRGKAELTPQGQEVGATPVSTGLDKDYVFAWSYGKAETWSLMIPNVQGGVSGGTLGKNSHLYQELKSHGAQVGKEIQSATYWGDQPFTSGPVYFGAIVCFLFLFAFFLLPKNYKWWLLGATVFFIFLAWGRNLAWFNDWMYYHFPAYGKFRAVSMALVIPAFTFPILAVLALKSLITDDIETLKLKKSLYWSAGITGGICLLFWLMPGAFFNFESVNDAQIQTQVPEWYYGALLEDRQDLLKSDALRSLIFIALAAGLVWVYIQSKNRKKSLPYLAAGLVILVLIDLWQVDKRYLGAQNFMSKKTHQEQSFPKSTADNFILQDPELSYRVLNLNNPFNESGTSYYHKSIGGYSAAKLGRYQDLIDRRLTKEISAITAALQTVTLLEELNALPATVLVNCPTLNMLNTKYIIYHPEREPLENPYIDGNAWFVDSYKFTTTPDEEIAALETLNPKTEAVFDKSFESNLSNFKLGYDSLARIEMTAYYPNKIEYQSSSSQAGLAVFSEVYYKNGWKAFVDGERVEISRADWVLRAIPIPAGKHHIEFVFDPDDVRAAGTITTIFSGLLVLLLIGSLIIFVIARVKPEVMTKKR